MLERNRVGKPSESAIKGRFVLRFSLAAIAVFAVVMAAGYLGWYLAGW